VLFPRFLVHSVAPGKQSLKSLCFVSSYFPCFNFFPNGGRSGRRARAWVARRNTVRLWTHGARAGLTLGGTEARVAPKISLGGKAVRVTHVGSDGACVAPKTALDGKALRATRVGSDGGRGAAGKTSATPPPLGSVRAMPRAKRDASMASAFLQAVKNVAWAGGCVVVEGATET